MQKLIAILFILLLGSATFTQGVPAPFAVEQLADSDKGKEIKDDKKEGKEFITHYPKSIHAKVIAVSYSEGSNFLLPQPLLRKPTPPPNVIC